MSLLKRISASTLFVFAMIAATVGVATPARASTSMNCTPTTDSMVLTFVSNGGDLHIKLPLHDFNGTVDWGNGVVDTYANGNVRPEYTYHNLEFGDSIQLCIDGTAEGFGQEREMTDPGPNGVQHFVQMGWYGSSALSRVNQWGFLGSFFNRLDSAFGQASRLTQVPFDLPSTVTSMSGIFQGDTLFNDFAVTAWDTSNVTDMSYAFADASNFNQDISVWRTDNVTNMASMFTRAANFNQDITAWKTGNVIDMSFMFDGATSFNQDINYNPASGAWDTSKVMDMKGMFENAHAFNGDISYWVTSAVGTSTEWFGSMNQMFFGAWHFNKNVNTKVVDPTGSGVNFTAWDISHVEDIGSMFGETMDFNQPLDAWDTSKVTDMSYMFSGAFDDDDNLIHPSVFNQDISGWDTNNVTNMQRMFWGNASFNQPIGTWHTQKVTRMAGLFAGATAFNQPIASWDTHLVEDMSDMFHNNYNSEGEFYLGDMAFNQPVGDWNTSRVQYMSGMFAGANHFAQNINYNADSRAWDTSHVTYMDHMFDGATAFDRDIGDWNTSQVVDMEYMFSGAHFANPLFTGQDEQPESIRTPSQFNQDITRWNTSSVTNFAGMFFNNTSFNQEINRNLRTGSWNTSSATNMGGMFGGASAFNADISGWSTTNVRIMSSMFGGAAAFNHDLRYTPATEYSPSAWDTRNVIAMGSMFAEATAFNGDISNWNTGNVTDMTNMFRGKYADDWGGLLTAGNFNRDISNWDTHSVDVLYGMFAGDTAFNQDISQWDVRDVYSIDHMFLDARAFNQDIGGWEFTHLENISSAFQNARAFNQDLSNWNLSTVENATHAFDNSGLSRLNFSKVIRAWATDPHQHNGILGATGLQHYSTVNPDISILTNDGWTIVDDGGWAAATPNIYSMPSASTITTSELLSASNLSGGAASVPGSFAFASPGTRLAPGVQPVGIRFTPSDSISQETVDTSITITVRGAPNLRHDPSIRGTALVGRTLTLGTGLWLAYPAPSITQQWYRCIKSVSPHLTSLPAVSKCAAIRGATRTAYKATTADRGKYLTVLVKARNALGTANATAASTAKVR